MADQTPLMDDVAPPPRVSSVYTYSARVLYVTLVVGVCFYAFNLNDTPDRRAVGFGKEGTTVFLWHPYFMVLAYTVCMTEALVSFAAHPTHEASKGGQKRWHVFLHILSGTCAILALTAVIAHRITEKESILPDSGHSYLGVMCLLLHATQFILGSTNILGPKGKPGSPHRFMGLCLYFLALATIVAGFVEHSTEHKAFKPCARTMMPGVVALALFVGIHFRSVVKPEMDSHV